MEQKDDVERERRKAIWLERFSEEALKKGYVGYVPDFGPFERYAEVGLCCPYHHCIELMPLFEGDEPTELSCPVFSHDCPGGIMQGRLCNSHAEPN